MTKPGWQLSRGQRVTYAVGMFSSAIVTANAMSWLLYFYSPPRNAIDQGMVFLGIGVAVGLARLFGSSIDALTNPLVAFWSDRSTNPRGRRVPFIRRGTLPLMLLAMLIWFPPVRGASTWNVLWLALTLGGTWFFYTYVVAPYLALMPEISSHPEERVSLTVTMSYFEAGAGVIAALAVPPVIEALRGGVQLGPVFLADGFKVTAIVLAVIGGVGFFVSISRVRETPLPKEKRVTFSLLRSVAECFRNPAFVPYLLAASSAKIAVGIMVICMPFLATAVLHKGEGFTAVLQAPLFLSTVVGFSVAQAVVNRVGLKRSFLAAAGIAAVLVAGFFGVNYLGGKPLSLTASETAADGQRKLVFGEDVTVRLTADEWDALFAPDKQRFDEKLYVAAPALSSDELAPGGRVRMTVDIGTVSEPAETVNLDGWRSVFSSKEERAAMGPVQAQEVGAPLRVDLLARAVYQDGSMVFTDFRVAPAALARLRTATFDPALTQALENPARLEELLSRLDMRVEREWSARIWLALFLCFLLGFPAAVLMSMYRPIVCEVVDLDEQRVGARREAMYFGVEGLLTKMADGVSAVVAPALMLAGHVLAPAPFGYVFPFLASTFFMGLAFLAFRRYPLGASSPRG